MKYSVFGNPILFRSAKACAAGAISESPVMMTARNLIPGQRIASAYAPRSKGHADRADRVGIEGFARPVHRDVARPGDAGEAGFAGGPSDCSGSMERRAETCAEVRASKPMDEPVSRPQPHRQHWPTSAVRSYKDEGFPELASWRAAFRERRYKLAWLAIFWHHGAVDTEAAPLAPVGGTGGRRCGGGGVRPAAVGSGGRVAHTEQRR
jgi:hypothetical protein